MALPALAIPLIAAGTAIMGSAMGNDANRAATRETNLMNSGMADTQMRWQEHQSNTAHQREVKDLIAAGLNPTLSAGGNGSSTPSGAMATAQAPTIQMPDFMQIAGIAQEQEKINMQKSATAAGIAKTLSDTDLNKMKTILSQKGMIKAQVEGRAAGYVDKFLNYIEKQGGRIIKNNPLNQNQKKPTQQNSSGGNLP